jgi:hypothetical protein
MRSSTSDKFGALFDVLLELRQARVEELLLRRGDVSDWVDLAHTARLQTCE